MVLDSKFYFVAPFLNNKQGDCLPVFKRFLCLHRYLTTDNYLYSSNVYAYAYIINCIMYITNTYSIVSRSSPGVQWKGSRVLVGKLQFLFFILKLLKYNILKSFLSSYEDTCLDSISCWFFFAFFSLISLNFFFTTTVSKKNVLTMINLL